MDQTTELGHHSSFYLGWPWALWAYFGQWFNNFREILSVQIYPFCYFSWYNGFNCEWA